MARKRKSHSGIWMLFWIIIILVGLIIFLQNGKDKPGKSSIKEKISNSFKKVQDYISKESEKDKMSVKGRKMDVELYFVRYIEKNDQLALEKVTRSIPLSGTPLMDTINLLLEGPTSSEERRKISSVFLANTRLKSARIENKIALLNFNSEIESGVGISTLQARLYQVVYTATQFPEVEGVRILINGKAKNTFSTEGLSIKRPIKRLNRNPVF